MVAFYLSLIHRHAHNIILISFLQQETEKVKVNHVCQI